MAATREYRIVYVVDDADALRKIGGIDAALKSLDRTVGEVGKSIARLNKSLDGSALARSVGQVLDQMKKLELATDKTTISSKAANKEITAFGNNTKSIDDASQKLMDLAELLSKVAIRGTAAKASVAGVGSGVRGPGGGAGGGGGGSVFSNAVGALGRRTVFAGVRAVGEATSSSITADREFGSRSVGAFQDFRKELQEIANLRGDKTVTSETISDQLEFMRKTGMNADESIRFREQFMGAIASGKARGNIDDATAKDLEIQAAQFAQRYNISPETAGKMSGLMGEFGKIPSGKAGAAKMAETAHHLNVLGVGQVGAMMPSLVGLQGEMLDENGGRFGSMESLSARFAATTIRSKTPATAATQIRQANRALRRFGDDEAGATLDSLGITPEDDYETALRKMSKFITGPDGDLWLRQNGFNNSTERDSLIKQARLIPVVDAQLGNESADMTPAQRLEARRGRMAIEKVRSEAVSQNQGYLTTDIGKQRQTENRAFTQQIRTGQQRDAFARARVDAETRLRKEGKIDTPTTALQDIATNLYSNAGLGDGREDRIERQAFDDLMTRGKAVGIDVKKRYPDAYAIYGGSGYGGGLGSSQGDRAAAFNNITADIERAEAARAGGGAGGNPAAKVAQAGQLLQQAAAQMNRPVAPKAPGAPPGFVAGRP